MYRWGQFSKKRTPKSVSSAFGGVNRVFFVFLRTGPGLRWVPKKGFGSRLGLRLGRSEEVKQNFGLIFQHSKFEV